MQIRIIRLGSRNPVVRVALTIVAVALLVAILFFGLVLLAGLAAVGTVALVVRRLLGGRRGAAVPGPVLDPAGEVFPAGRAVSRGGLPEKVG